MLCLNGRHGPDDQLWPLIGWAARGQHFHVLGFSFGRLHPELRGGELGRGVVGQLVNGQGRVLIGWAVLHRAQCLADGQVEVSRGGAEAHRAVQATGWLHWLRHIGGEVLVM